jgi:branched-subunit amino acid transport protein
VSWVTLGILVVGAYGFKVLGLFAFDARPPSPRVLDVLRLLPAALLGALIVAQTFAVGESLQIDARAAGVLAGGFAAWRRAPFIVVLVVAAGVTATVRAVA